MNIFGIGVRATDEGESAWVVQIGAHIGFEANDPLGSTMAGLLGLIGELKNQQEPRWKWLMVEPVPSIIPALKVNTEAMPHRNGEFIIEPAGVVDEAQQDSHMTFYSIEDIDSDTGLDRRTGKILPFWITQIGSFDRDHLTKPAAHAHAFKKRGLAINDYVTAQKVPTLTIEQLFRKHSVATGRVMAILIDAEGLDCKIVISLESNILDQCPLILFEHKHCEKGDFKKAMVHIRSSGFSCYRYDTENTLCSKSCGPPSLFRL